MASANLSVDQKIDWPVANPWLWLAAGLALCAWSWLWTLTFGAISSELRIIVLAVGLLFSGVGIWLRFADRHTAYVARCLPFLATLLRQAMGALFGAIALGVSVLFVASFFAGDDIGWRTAPTLLVWLSAAPLAFYAARRCLVRDVTQGTLDVEEEIALAFVIGAAGAFAGSWTLYLGAAWADDWDTMRLFLRVLTVAGLGGAALVLVSTQLRRMVLSFLFLLHFVGICTACLSAPPAPWLIQQGWVRIFRPYLEFMYLNNAYHFYAPEPGPASYLWFRLIYTDENGKEQGWWYRVPDMDEEGRHHHSVALEYQRFLAMTESTAPYDPPPPWVFTNMNNFGVQFLDISPIYKNRLLLQPDVPIAPGERNLTRYPRIPLHPLIPQAQQVIIPNENSRRLLESYARFVARKFAKHPEHPDWTFKSVKVYHVLHAIPTVDWYERHLAPADPVLYRPYYVGNYAASGELLDGKDWEVVTLKNGKALKGAKVAEDEKLLVLTDDEGQIHKLAKADIEERQVTPRDPYMYWLLPILRANIYDPNLEIKDFCRLHAGDSAWVRPAGKKEFEDPRR